MPEPRKAELLRGLAWNIPAAVGGPVDLIEQVINLGLAGGGTALHKMGAIRADQLPKPLEGSIGTTKWWAKGTPMEESADPKFVQGQLAGTLATALYGGLANMPLARDSKLRSIITPEDWPWRFGLAKTMSDGRPLGELPGDLPGTKHVALPRKLSADDTFSARNRAQIDQPGGVPLAQLAPELVGSPAEELRVVSGRHAATPLNGAGGHADMANNELVIGLGDPGQPLDSRWLMNVLHHEGTHGVDALAGVPGHGFAPLRSDEFTRSLDWLSKNGPEGKKIADWMRIYQPSQFYRGNLGEARAFTAGDTANHLSPSTATLELYNKKNRAQHPMNWYTQVQDGEGWFRMPLPEELLRDKRLQFTARKDGWDAVALGDPASLSSTPIGVLDQRFRLQHNQPGGKPDPALVNWPRRP